MVTEKFSVRTLFYELTLPLYIGRRIARKRSVNVCKFRLGYTFTKSNDKRISDAGRNFWPNDQIG